MSLLSGVRTAVRDCGTGECRPPPCSTGRYARPRGAVWGWDCCGGAARTGKGGLLSGWLMRGMSGVFGLHGWQWMFAIEGAPAILLGVIAWFWLCDRPEQASWLSDRKSVV